MKFKRYIKTQFMKPIVRNVNESSLSRVWNQVKKHDSGTITAYRYASECNTGIVYNKSDNKKRNEILFAKLAKLGYGITKLKGVYIENYKSDNEKQVKEESFLVIDIKDKGNLKKDLIKLGEEFEQDSITYSKPNGEYYLISTNTCKNGYPGKGKIGVEIKLGESFFGKKGEFFSKVNGRPFVFEFCENIIYDITKDYPTHIRSMLAMIDINEVI